VCWAFPWWSVSAQLAIETIVHCVYDFHLVWWTVHVLHQLLHVNLVVAIRPLGCHVRLDVRPDELQASSAREAFRAISHDRIACMRMMISTSLCSKHLRLEALRIQGHHVCITDLAVCGIHWELLWQGCMNVWILEFSANHLNKIVLVNGVSIFQQSLQSLLSNPLRQSPRCSLGFYANLLDKGLRQEGCLARMMQEIRTSVDKLIRDDGNVVVGILLRAVQINVREAPTRDGGRSLQEIILSLASLHTARSWRALIMSKMGQLAHETAPIDDPIL
jgi:hypothetical protein